MNAFEGAGWCDKHEAYFRKCRLCERDRKFEEMKAQLARAQARIEKLEKIIEGQKLSLKEMLSFCHDDSCTDIGDKKCHIYEHSVARDMLAALEAEKGSGGK